MIGRKRLFFLMLSLLSFLSSMAQPLCTVTKYDEADGVPSSHVTQLLQDDRGFMWFATWNGLCRYDGYDFQTFKPKVGDGCSMTTDRIRNISLLPTNQILCRVDQENYLFDLSNYRFRDLTDEERLAWSMEGETMNYRQSRSLLNRDYFEWEDAFQTRWRLRHSGRLTFLSDTGQEVDYPLPLTFRTLTFAMTDNSGNLWALDYGSIYKFCTDKQRTQRLDIQPRAEVKSLFSDSKGRYWVTTKDDETVRVYHCADDRLLGYLGSDGRLHRDYTRFGAAVYCMLEGSDGTLWLGTKPKGLFRLQPQGVDAFKIDHFIDNSHREIYHLQYDRYDRLWVATLDGGLCYISHPSSGDVTFSVPRNYPKKVSRARYILIRGEKSGVSNKRSETMLIATSHGLLATRLLPDADKMQFVQHQREPDRQESLSCSATMDVVQDARGRLFVSTESGGVNQIANGSLLEQGLTFQPLISHHSPLTSDVVQSLTVMPDGGLIAVGSHLITLLDSMQQGRVLETRNFHADYRFSEAHPLLLKGNRWLFGLMDGACVMSAAEMFRKTHSPCLVLTSLAVNGGDSRWAIERYDTLTLQPQERNVTIRFAAIDYDAPERISYAFRLLPNEQWSYIGHDRSATLLDMEPGTYTLEIQCTNADGQWQDNLRRLTIIVKPSFWEAWYGQLLIVLLIMAVIGLVIYTLLYIRRIKRRQHETLEKYLALIEVRSERLEAREDEKEQTAEENELDPMIKRVMQFVEEHIGNSDASVGDMAAAAATSRSGLQRKLKQSMGITPQDLMREARIKRACQLLQQTDKNIAEVAYACGFTDPKYFSRSFKQSTGLSPTEYREKH